MTYLAIISDCPPLNVVLEIDPTRWTYGTLVLEKTLVYDVQPFCEVQHEI